MLSELPEVFDRAARVPDHVHVREVAEELVILSLESEEYFGLNPVGTRIWQLLQSEATVRGAYEAMLFEYEVDEAALASDLELLLSELASRGLIQLVEPTAAAPRP